MLGLLLDFVIPVLAIILSLWAIATVTRRRLGRETQARLAGLEAEVRALVHRVWTLEQAAGVSPVDPTPAASPPASVAEPAASPGAAAGAAVPPRPAAGAAGRIPIPLPPSETPPAAPRPGEGQPPAPDLEHRIGARWSTWVGALFVLVAVALFFRWAFERDLLGPGWRVVLGLLAGLVVLAAGTALGRRRDLPYLSSGLAGLGLAVLYVSIHGAHALHGFVAGRTALAAMSAVTLLGAAASVIANRQPIAVLALLGGLATPVLLAAPERDERNLLAYLLVLDALVLAVAMFRTWPGLNRLAWFGTALLVLPVLLTRPDAPQPLSRLLLLSALFALFLAVPLVRRAGTGGDAGRIDLLLAVANAAGYFYAVHLTLAGWQPRAGAAWALALSVLYRVVAAEHAARARRDEAAVVVHEGLAWTFLTLTVPLALSGPWVTLGWAVEGTALLWAAARTAAPAPAWIGAGALALAAWRVAAVNVWGGPGVDRVWNLTFLVHLLTVLALVVGGGFAARSRPGGGAWFTGPRLRSGLWLLASLVLALVLWREPRGLWPAALLAAELLAVAAAARVSRSGGLLLAAPAVAVVLLARVLWADDALARAAADTLLNRPLAARVAAGLALVVAGGWVARSAAAGWASRLGRAMSAAGGLTLLFVSSLGWARYQDGLADLARSLGQDRAVAEIRWRLQVGLSILWALSAGLALGWGFLRSRPGVRYAALALLGATAVKVFLVDLAAVRTAARIVSFLVVGIVLLLVGFAYQKVRRREGPLARAPAPGDGAAGP